MTADSSDDTKTAFLDAAEHLFAEHGFAGASIRAIAEAARANLGALHYYWGSKEALFRAVCERRLRPVVNQRLRRLNECAMAANGKPTLAAVLEAAVVPVLINRAKDAQQSRDFGALMARASSDPSAAVKAIFADIFREASGRYVELLRQCCPHLDDQSFYWRLHGVFGMTHYVGSGNHRIVELSQGKFIGDDMQTGIAEIIQFIEAGLSAPAPKSKPPGKRKRTMARTRARRG